MRYLTNGLFAAFLCLVIVSAANAEIVVLRDGFLVDTNDAKAYVMLPKGGIAALATDSGEEVWRSVQADLPLGVEGRTLVAMADLGLAGNIEIRTLDSGSGALIAASSINVGRNVPAQVNHTLSHTFRIVADAPGNPSAIAWRHDYRPPRGMPTLPDEVISSAQREGAFELQPATAQVSLLPAPPPGIFAARTPPAPAAVSPATPGRHFASQDGRHLLVVTNADGGFRRHHWRLFDAEGNLLSQLRHFISYAPFVVSGDRLLLIEPPHTFVDADGDTVERELRLLAYELGTGNEAWSTPVRDIEYRGPFPR